jgi:Response regulators consisting of a CheY-like receiver domain and a winged-helix DNA-binding domain
MQANVLVVEDVKEMSELIALFLSKEGMSVRTSETAEEALPLLVDERFDIIVLDINLPGMDGFEFLDEARKTTDCPVLIVTARGSDEDLIAGLGQGADEYMVKPFSPKVLVARVRALLRRSRGLSERTPAEAFSFGPFVLDRSAFEFRKAGELISLSVKEFGVLSYLVDHADAPQTPQAIYDAVWRREYGDLTAVAVYIQRLRRKIEDDPAEPVYIETVYGRGYRFNLDGKPAATAEDRR